MIRIGNGYDIHRIKEGEFLTLANTKIKCNYSFIAHSDGDVVIHSLIDALLGSLALKDIGYYFPPSDEKYKNIDSKVLLLETLNLIKPINIFNIDFTIILEEPKLKDHILTMRSNLAKILDIDISQISIKAKTNETLDSIGNKKAVACYCSLLLEKTTC